MAFVLHQRIVIQKRLCMKSRRKNDVLIAAASGIAAGLLVFAVRLAKREYTSRKKLKEIADHGYETATDVLYPDDADFGKKLHYGPVLPN